MIPDAEAKRYLEESITFQDRTPAEVDRVLGD
jgi:hypothetical protein